MQLCIDENDIWFDLNAIFSYVCLFQIYWNLLFVSRLIVRQEAPLHSL